MKVKSSGQPTAVRTSDMIEIVWELISTDRRMTILKMEAEISRETIRRILVEDVGKQKSAIYARFVPHCLAEEQKALRLQVCQGFIQSMNDHRSLLDSIVTDD
jgi:hypothetical protein